MAVLTKPAFLNETISTNQTLTIKDFYSKTYKVNTTAGNISITLPFAGGGAPTGASVLIVNSAGANNTIITYQSGVSVTLPPGGHAFLVFEGTRWELVDNNVQQILTSFLQLAGASGVKLTGDATKLNVRNAANTEYRDIQVRSVIAGLLADIDTGAAWVRVQAEDGGGEWLSNAVEAAGVYTRKYANSAFRIKHEAVTNHIVNIDVAIDGTAGSSITWIPAYSIDCLTGTISVSGLFKVLSAGAAFSTNIFLTNGTDDFVHLYTNTANGNYFSRSNAYDPATPKLRLAGYSVSEVRSAVSGITAWQVSQNGAANDVISYVSALSVGPALVESHKPLTVSGGDLTISGAGNTLILSGDKYIGNLVVVDQTSYSADVVVVSGLTSGIYLILVEALCPAGTYVSVREGGTVGAGTNIGQFGRSTSTSDTQGAIVAISEAAITAFNLDFFGASDVFRLAYMRIS